MLAVWILMIMSNSAFAATVTPFSIVTTTGMIADAAVNIAGERAKVTSLMGEGVDPHLYKASPKDVRMLSDADLILYNGLHLEGRMADVLVRLAARKSVVQVTDAIDDALLREPPEFKGQYDPHVWFDVRLWIKAAERIRSALIDKDADGKSYYTENARRYITALAQLDQRVRQKIQSIPQPLRLLVTAHDAFGYFGQAYGIEVMAIQGISTDSEASIKDMNRLVDTIVGRRIPAIFMESSVPRKTIDALVDGCKARKHLVKIGGELFSDAMGKAGTAEGTYIGMVEHNVNAIVNGLK